MLTQLRFLSDFFTRVTINFILVKRYYFIVQLTVILQWSTGSVQEYHVWSPRGSWDYMCFRTCSRKYSIFFLRLDWDLWLQLSNDNRTYIDRWWTIDRSEASGSQAKTFGAETCPSACYQSARYENRLAATGSRQETWTGANGGLSRGG